MSQITALLEKGNPNRDPKSGQFTHGAGGPRTAGGGGGAGGGSPTGADTASGSVKPISEGKDITSELGKEYGTDSETKRAQELRLESMEPGTRGDVVLKEIASKQGFTGEADMVDQQTFDKIVADGGTVTYRGITDYYNGPGPDAKYIAGEAGISEEFAKGSYFAGQGGYGSGSYTSSDLSVAQHYASEDGKSGGVITMVVKPGAKIATPQQWQAARQAARDGKGGFMGADNEGRILAAQGFDGFRIASKNVDHFSNQFTIILNRTAVAVLKK